MQIEPKQILSQFDSMAKTVLQETFLSWYHYHQGKIGELQSILDPLKIHLVQTDEWVHTPEELWQENEAINQRMVRWINSLQYLPADLDIDQLSRNWNEQFDRIEKNLPEEIRILIGSTFWQIQPDDSVGTRLRKRYHTLRRWLQLRFLSIHNLGRRLLKRAPLKSEDIQHHIPLHNFLYHFLSLPYKQFLFAEWQRLLQAISGQYFVMQMKSTELNQKILLIDKFPLIYDLNQKINIFDELYELAEILKSVDETLQVLAGYEKQFRIRLDKILAEVDAQFQTAWNEARTFQINNKKYSQKRIKKIDRQLQVQARKSIKLWHDHFHGLRHDWQKSLQLGLLQFRSAHILRKVARNTDEKIRTQVDPVFQEIGHLLTDTETRFGSDLKLNDLEKLIKFENETTLRSLLQPKLALLIDAIHQVQIINDLESFPARISADLEEVNSTYTVFLKRDTENSPPHSRLADIPMRQIIRAYAYNDLVAANRPTLTRLRDRLEKTIRSISETDQILEHAFDSALNLIYQQGADLQVQEPLSIIRDAFSRIKKLVTALNSEMDAIPQQATASLVDDLQEFENHLQSLYHVKKNLALKKRLNRQEKPSRLKKPGQWLTGLMQRPMSRVRNKLFPGAGRFNQREKSYLLNEPIPLPLDAIGAFLGKMQGQADHLPFVYQRLFLLQPLKNHRFFYGRETEMATIHRQFIGWKNGSRTCLAVVGEEGSGKTSLLNHIGNKVFGMHPLIKLDLEEKIYSESRLAEFLKQKLNYPTASTLTELEIRIRHEQDGRVCIVENLHNMFLRMVNGLDALEKFLLLMNRTQDKIFWIITCNRYAWNYFDNVLNISRNFSHILTLDSLSMPDMKNILVTRHRVSGYDIDFEIPKSWYKNRKLRKSLGRHTLKHRLMADFFFNELNRVSAGNITIALLHWLRAVHKFADDKLILMPYVRFDYSFLNELPEEDLFTLVAVLIHEILSPADHARLFRQIPENSAIQMARLQNYGLLIPSEKGFRVNSLIHRPLVDLLSAQNMLP